MNTKSLSLVAGILFLLSTSAFAQDKLEVHAQLKLADNKSTFKIGEPIRVVLELTADRDGYNADSTSDVSDSSTDQLTVTPEAGISHWRRGFWRQVPARLLLNPEAIGYAGKNSIRTK
jgi:hypothetical protein